MTSSERMAIDTGKEVRGSQHTLTATDRIVEDLHAALREGQLKAGEKAPSRRALAERYGVSSLTVTAAFRRLTARGVVRHVPGRGLFVAGAEEIPSALPFSIGLIGWFASQPGCEEESGSYWRGILFDLMAAAARSNISLTLIPNTGVEPLDLEGILRHRPTVLMSHGLLLTEETITEIRRHHLPLVLGNRFAERLGVSYVDYDGPAACGELVRRCHGLGHTRIAFLLNRLLIPEVEERTFDAVCREAVACGLFYDYGRYWRSLVADRRTLTKPHRREFAHREALRLLREPEPPTVFCCMDEEMEAGVSDAARQCGMALGRDIGIVTFRSVDQGATSTFLAPHAELAAGLVAAAEEVARNPHAVRQTNVPMVFIDRGTIPPFHRAGAPGTGQKRRLSRTVK